MAARSRFLNNLDVRLVRGAVAGVSAGLVFLLANMGWAVRDGLPAVAPMLDISTIFNNTDKPVPSPENMLIGLTTHLTLSTLFGLAFASLVPFFRSRGVLVLGGLVFGVGLYLVNFQVLGRLLFEWFLEGPDQLFEVFIHAVYGLLLTPFLLGLVDRSDLAPQGRAERPTTAVPAH